VYAVMSQTLLPVCTCHVTKLLCCGPVRSSPTSCRAPGQDDHSVLPATQDTYVTVHINNLPAPAGMVLNMERKTLSFSATDVRYGMENNQSAPLVPVFE